MCLSWLQQNGLGALFGGGASSLLLMYFSLVGSQKSVNFAYLTVLDIADFAFHGSDEIVDKKQR
jgi:hypothetical protein